MAFTHLHVHSVHSLFHSTLTVKEAVNKALSLGMKSIAITDYDSLYSAYEIAQYASEVAKDFKVIVGCEIHIRPVLAVETSPHANAASHLTVLCKNEVGYNNLCKLLHIAWNEGFFFRPTVTFEQLATHKDGLIILSGCLGSEIAKNFIAGNLTQAEKVIECYRHVFQDDYYLELVRNGHNMKLEKEYAKFLSGIGNALHIKSVATNDVHRTTREDVTKIDRLVKYNFGETSQFFSCPTDDWLKSEEEMLEMFSDYPEAIDVTKEIEDKIECFEISKWTNPAKNWDESEYLKTVQHCIELRAQP